MEKEIYIKMKEIEDSHWWFCARREIIHDVISNLNLPQKCKILDCGCATGGNLSMLSEFGEVFGLEPDINAVNIARGKNIGKLFIGHLPDEISLLQGKFDLIVLLDVLEHIDDHISALKTLKSLLAKNGYLILTVPAFEFLYGKHDEEHHHKRRYSLPGLKAIISQSGLKLLYITYYNFWLFFIISLIRLLKKILPNKHVTTDLYMPHPLVNKFLFTVFSSERFFIGRIKFPLGVSLLAITKNDI